jgi:dTDP-4-amino-4,6-dideoxygalactose transaminase
MRSITRLARRHNLVVIEDAAHALPASYRRRPLGSIGQLATFSFHETKNVHCGEGGALVINDSALIDAAEIAQEKGTNRARFFRGQVDKYTWVGLGSSHLLSEVAAAFLWAQLERTDEITEIRKSIWASYHDAFEQLESEEVFRRPVVPDGCSHSGHLYYLLMPSGEARDDLIAALKDEGVHAVFHYVPLHDSPAGRRLGRASGELPVTSDVSERLLRLPLWAGLGDEGVATVIDAVCRTAPAISLSRSAVSR